MSSRDDPSMADPSLTPPPSLPPIILPRAEAVPLPYGARSLPEPEPLILVEDESADRQRHVRFNLDDAGIPVEVGVQMESDFGERIHREPTMPDLSFHDDSGNREDEYPPRDQESPSYFSDRRDSRPSRSQFSDYHASARSRERNFQDKRSHLFGYNTHHLVKCMDDYGVLGFFAIHVDEIGRKKMKDMYRITRGLYIREFGCDPPEITQKGQQEVQKRNIKENKGLPPLGGHGNYLDPQEQLEDPEFDLQQKFDTELRYTWILDRNGKPYHKNPAPSDGRCDYTTGHEKGLALMMEDIANTCGDPEIPDSMKFKALAIKMSGQGRARILEETRNTDLRLEEEMSQQASIPPPHLLHNADKTACMNDKTMREVNNRLSNKQFNGYGSDITCRSYLNKMRDLLHGKFNSDAAYQIMQSTTKGKPHQFLIDAIEFGSSFHFVWKSFCKHFMLKENPEEAMQKLLYLRQERPVDLSSRIIKMQEIATVAAFDAPAASRHVRNIEILRGEMQSMLNKWFPNHQRAIMLAEKKKRANWLAERDHLRRLYGNPDNFSQKSDYHPWFTLHDLCLSVLENIIPEERARGFVTRRHMSDKDKGKIKKRADIFQVGTTNKRVRSGSNEIVPSHLGPHYENIGDYAESLIDEGFDPDVDSEGESDSDLEQEVMDRNMAHWDDSDDSDSGSDEGLEADLDALHAKPGEVVRRFQERPRPIAGSGERREPYRNDRRDGKDRRRDGDRKNSDPRREQVRPRGEGRSNRKFPHEGNSDAFRYCALCGSTNHNWNYCGTYGGCKPVSEKRSCCGFYHPDSCKIKEARDLDAKKRARAQERRARKD